MKKEASVQSLTERIAETIRLRIISGDLVPGARLSETALSEQIGISRNTLREVFRILTLEGLIRHEPHRGVSVAVPDIASVIDIYRIRQMTEGNALRNAYALHPAVTHMADAVERARYWQLSGDWQQVGTENMRFHTAIVELTDSERLIRFYRQVSAELRLAFGHLDDHEMLHAPYIEKNATILALLQAGRNDDAANAMSQYLTLSERTVLAALNRRQQSGV